MPRNNQWQAGIFFDISEELYLLIPIAATPTAEPIISIFARSGW
jgi:hypothetical protein